MKSSLQILRGNPHTVHLSPLAHSQTCSFLANAPAASDGCCDRACAYAHLASGLGSSCCSGFPARRATFPSGCDFRAAVRSFLVFAAWVAALRRLRVAAALRGAALCLSIIATAIPASNDIWISFGRPERCPSAGRSIGVHDTVEYAARLSDSAHRCHGTLRSGRKSDNLAAATERLVTAVNQLATATRAPGPARDVIVATTPAADRIDSFASPGRRTARPGRRAMSGSVNG
jgi:hypothetical protein